MTHAISVSGRRELVGAGVAGRHAPLTAVLAVVSAANLLIAVLMSVVPMSGGLPAGGSVALGQTSAAPLLALTAVAAALTALGVIGLRRRDLG
ncbi:hypothetical protein [Nonomuraea sp. NPDC049141]|uniref:hypothetical protein n=1 Tax=Nonomuraea sp. NPDC049141 TaxID=3155500 RepID=UPI0033F40B28